MRLLLVPLSLLLAVPASADLVLSLDAPIGPNGLPRYFVTLPAVGTKTLDITGSLVGNTRDRVTGSDELALELNGNMKGADTAFDDQINDALAATGSYFGPLFTYTFEAGDEVGVYTCEHFAFGSLFDLGGATNPVEFEVEAQPVPEPASMAALGLGALALLRRRRTTSSSACR